MINQAVIIFLGFVGLTLGISFYLGRRTKSSQGYFAAHGQIPWFVNGVAFAGDYLSAASFLGICGMIAFYGYDGFLYSIGYLAGWIVALFVVAEPMKRLGKYTFADALNAKFDSPGIKLAAGVSTLAVSVFYLIPQMVGAGALVKPLLGLEHWHGVVIVGAVVICIVVTAGMVSTTWVQFLKGALLIIFSTVLVASVLQRGLVESASVDPETAVMVVGDPAGKQFRNFAWESWSQEPLASFLQKQFDLTNPRELREKRDSAGGPRLLQFDDPSTGGVSTWRVAEEAEGSLHVWECQTLCKTSSGELLINGLPESAEGNNEELAPVGSLLLPESIEGDGTGPIGPIAYLRVLQESEVVLWRSEKVVHEGGTTTVYYPQPTPGSHVLRPGEHPNFRGIRSGDLIDKVNFLSLMLALFCGTASLPHILIRYYTVKDEAAARKSTIVGIACIGFFYVLTLYMGLGAMVSGALDPSDSNMAAPLLARSINDTLFAIISAIAFTTVLGTVSGLILASAGAVAHDLVETLSPDPLTDVQRVRIAKIASVCVGIVAIVLGIVFKGMNVSYLVGWAFSIAASANLPALVMLLFWPRTTKQGVIVSILVGMVSSLAWVLLSQDTFVKVYGLSEGWLTPFSQPGIVTIPLGFLTLVAVSLLTGNAADATDGD